MGTATLAGRERRRSLSRTLVEALDRRLYPGRCRNWDDRLFREAILAALPPDARLLDLGAGAGIVPYMDFKGVAGHVVGVDPDERVRENPHVDEAHVGVGEALPCASASFDVVVADNVLEHLERPERVFAEVARVLAPGGVFLAKTPNRAHYVPLLARLTPHAFHRFANRLRGRRGEDTFPTRYRANTPRAIERLARGAGLRVRSVRLVEDRPEYMRLHPLTYLVGWAYERVVNALPCLAPLRILMLVELEKESAAERAA